jgi:predicted DNA-binding transcriptional regulator AlpA
MDAVKETGAQYLTLKQLAAETGISESSLAIKISHTKKLGIEPPPRKRIGKHFLYCRKGFAEWLWKHGTLLCRKFEMQTDADQ